MGLEFRRVLFRSAQGRLPPSVLGSGLPRDLNPGSPFLANPHVGTLAFLLPYIEQDNLYKTLVVDWNGANGDNPVLNPPGSPGAAWWYGSPTMLGTSAANYAN